MDGKDRMILHSTNIIWPNALTIDYATQFIYWIDARLDYIESSFRDGTHRMVLYRETVRHFRPFGLTLFKDELYMTDIDAREVRVFKVKENRNELVTVYTEIVEPMSVIAVHSTRQPDCKTLYYIQWFTLCHSDQYLLTLCYISVRISHTVLFTLCHSDQYMLLYITYSRVTERFLFVSIYNGT